jgi:murein L,D-transpeptidase YcbB/YkuD
MSRTIGLVVMAAGVGVIGLSLHELLVPGKAKAGTGPTTLPPAVGKMQGLPSKNAPAVTASVMGSFDLTPCAVHGAYKSNPACIAAYQSALSYLSSTLNKPLWSVPTSGQFDAATMAAVKAFQSDTPPLKVDGKVGKSTTAAISGLVAANLPATAPPSIPTG